MARRSALHFQSRPAPRGHSAFSRARSPATGRTATAVHAAAAKSFKSTQRPPDPVTDDHAIPCSAP
eukprot:2224576-Pyramimonas_sp.AAC.1